MEYRKAYEFLLGQYGTEEMIKSIISSRRFENDAFVYRNIRQNVKGKERVGIMYGVAKRGDLELFKVLYCVLLKLQLLLTCAGSLHFNSMTLISCAITSGNVEMFRYVLEIENKNMGWNLANRNASCFFEAALRSRNSLQVTFHIMLLNHLQMIKEVVHWSDKNEFTFETSSLQCFDYNYRKHPEHRDIADFLLPIRPEETIEWVLGMDRYVVLGILRL